MRFLTPACLLLVAALPLRAAGPAPAALTPEQPLAPRTHMAKPPGQRGHLAR